MAGYHTLLISPNETTTASQSIARSLTASTLNLNFVFVLIQNVLGLTRTRGPVSSKPMPDLAQMINRLLDQDPLKKQAVTVPTRDLYSMTEPAIERMMAGLLLQDPRQEQAEAEPTTDLYWTTDGRMENEITVESVTHTMISPTNVWRPSQSKYDIIYGRAMFATKVYKYLYLLILGTCLLKTLMLVFTLSKKL